MPAWVIALDVVLIIAGVISLRNTGRPTQKELDVLGIETPEQWEDFLDEMEALHKADQVYKRGARK